MGPRLGRRLAIIFAATALISSIAVPASAHYVYQSTQYARIGDTCFTARSEVSHGSKSPYGGYWKTDSDGFQDWNSPIGTLNCYFTYSEPDKGYAAAIQKMKKSSTGVWGVCGPSSGWGYSGTNDVGVAEIWDYGGDAPPCGSGGYANFGRATAKDPANGYDNKPGG